jgi:hypothetical protein
MFGIKNTSSIAYLFLLIIWSYTFYVSVINPPFFGYFSVDENFIADSGVFLWYGNTPRGLDWPASPSILIAFILFGSKVLVSILSGSNNSSELLDLFKKFDVEAFNYLTSRENFIIELRAIQLIEVGIILILLIRFFFSRKHKLLTPITRQVLAYTCVSSYVIWFNAPVLRPEALAGVLFMYLLSYVIFTDVLDKNSFWVIPVLFGVILSERLLFVFVSPIVLGAVYFLSDSRKSKRTIYSLLLIIGVFIILCPFLITDTLVVLKSFVGGILAKMQDKPMTTLFNVDYVREYLSSPISYLIIILCGFGIWKLLSSKSPFHWILIGNWFLFLVLVLRSSKIYDTHVLPAGILTVIISALGIVLISEKINKGWLIASVLVVVLILPSLTSYWEFQKRSHVVSNIEMAFHWINTLPSNTRLLVLPELEFYLPKSINCLAREAEQNRDPLKMVRKIGYLLGRKDNGSQFDLPLVAKSFCFEDERQYDIQYQILMQYYKLNSAKRYDYDVYLETVELASHSVPTTAAIADFKSGKYSYFIADIKLEGMEPIKVFIDNLRTPVYCYKVL